MEKLTENFEKQIKVTRVDDNDKDSADNITIDYFMIMNEILRNYNFDGEIIDIFVIDDIDVELYHNYGIRRLVKKQTINLAENDYYFKRYDSHFANSADNATFYFNFRIVLSDENGDENTEDIYIERQTYFNW